MAITLNQPNGSEYFYAYKYSTEAVNEIYNKIMFESSGDATVTISYSLDSGSTWTVIEATIDLTALAAYKEGSDYVYYWQLDSTEYAAIFGAVDTVATCQIRVAGDVTGNVDSAADFTIRKVIINLSRSQP